MADEDLLLDCFIQHLKLLIHVARCQWQHRWCLGGIIVEGDNKAACVIRAAELALNLTLNVDLLFGRGDAVVEVNQVASPEIVAQVVVVEVGDLNIGLNPRQASKVLRQWVVLHTS